MIRRLFPLAVVLLASAGALVRSQSSPAEAQLGAEIVLRWGASGGSTFFNGISGDLSYLNAWPPDSRTRTATRPPRIVLTKHLRSAAAFHRMAKLWRGRNAAADVSEGRIDAVLTLSDLGTAIYMLKGARVVSVATNILRAEPLPYEVKLTITW